MLTLLLGPDDFTKKQYARELAEKQKAELDVIRGSEGEVDALELTEQDLFSKPKVFLLDGCFAKINWDKVLDRLVSSANTILVAEEKLDKRLQSTKAVLAHKKLETKNFALPHGKELNKWIEQRAKYYGITIATDAVELLAVRLGRDEAKETKIAGKVIDVKEIYTLWGADSELQKLAALAGEQKQITKEMVEGTVAANIEPDTLAIVDALGNGNKTRALSLIAQFLSQDSASDEKGKIIQLNALLSEQFRNIYVLQDFTARRVSDEEILQHTGWKSGRLFVLRKIAQHFSKEKTESTLSKLEHLDEELKTSSTPPHVLLDMIITQA